MPDKKIEIFSRGDGTFEGRIRPDYEGELAGSLIGIVFWVFAMVIGGVFILTFKFPKVMLPLWLVIGVLYAAANGYVPEPYLSRIYSIPGSSYVLPKQKIVRVRPTAFPMPTSIVATHVPEVTRKSQAMLTVYANRDWQTTEIKIVPGDIIEVAVNGSWKLNGGSGQSNGAMIIPKEQGGTVTDIIVKIGNGQPISIASNPHFVAKDEGEMFFRVNALENLDRFSGEVLVNVVINPKIISTPVASQSNTSSSNIIATINATVLNVRTGPTADDAILGKASKGTELPVLGKNNAGDWLKVSYKDREGWVATKFVTLNKPIESVPTVSSP